MRKPMCMLVVVGVVIAGCGGADKRLPTACLAGVARVERALAAAPAHVALGDGTRLSTCVRRARSDADFQEVGLIYTSIADSLAAQLARHDSAALRLGYLIGAARRGARQTGGIHDELVRRLEQSEGLGGVPANRRHAFDRGLRAALRRG